MPKKRSLSTRDATFFYQTTLAIIINAHPSKGLSMRIMMMCVKKY